MHRKYSARRRALAKLRRQVLRTSRFEELEDRRVLAAAIWTNPIQPLNVSGDDAEHVSPLDALLVINELNVRTITEPQTGRLPQHVPEPIEGPYLDVTCDGYVSPLDALIVINALNQGVRGGGGHDGSGMWPQLACSPHLIDGDSFVTEVNRTLTLPDDQSAIEVYFRAPAFDTSSEQMIRDAFEIEVTDQQGRPVSLPFTSQADAVFNWSEQTGPHAGASVTTTVNPPDQDSMVLINLAGLPAGTKVKATTRLVNNDADGTSQVIIRGFRIADAPTASPTGASFAETRPIDNAAEVDFTQLADLTSSFRPDYGRTTLRGNDDVLNTELTVTNLGQQAVTGELIVVLENFTSLDTFAMRPDGFTPAGDPYFNLTPEMQGRPLEPGQTLRSRRIEFLNRSGEQFHYRLKTFGKVNSAPSNFSTTPITVIEAGRTFVYQALASDVDGDRLTYSVEVGPEALNIDAASGRMQWVTTADDVGVHHITLTATDPHGLSASQSFSLEVVSSLQNRPPNFVTDPVTEAVASSGFEIDTLPGGTAPIDAALLRGPLGPRIVALDHVESALAVTERSVAKVWQVDQQVSTGDPFLGDTVFDYGYSVDVGLQPWTHSSDANQIEGMDQADLNQDGILDLVVMTWQRRTEEGSTRHEIVSILGDGDGGFGAPTVIASWLPSSAGSDGARNVLIEDFNNDGNLDVVATDRRTRQFIFVAGNGDGSFGPATITDVEYTLSDFRVADVDEDGTLDLIGRTAVLGFGATYTLVWLRGNGNGSFGDPQTIGPGGHAPNCCFTERTRAFATGDFNHDGHVDVAVGGHESSIQVYHGDGTGAFTEVFAIDPSGGAFARGPDWMEAADFTGDGNLDIAFYHTWETRVNLLVGDSTGANFTEQVNPVIGDIDNHAAGTSIADIDDDGDLDVVAALDTVKVLINDGAGQFALTHYEMVDFPGHLSDHYPPYSDAAVGAMFGDYNRDGVVDLAYMSVGVDFNGVGIRLGTRPGEFGASRGIAGVSNSETDVLPADFNGDGVIDLVSVRASSIMLGRGDGTYDAPFPAFSAGGASGNGSIADFNLDGLPDFVAPRSNLYFVGLSNGDGTFTISDEQRIEGSYYGIHFTEVADFNADGYPDFIAKAGVERTIDVYLNQGATAPGTFTRTFRTTVSAQGVNVQGFDQAVAVGDFNGDARQDFVAVDQLPGEPMKLVFFEGDNAGSFSPTQESFVYEDSDLSGFIYSGDLAAGDLNEDGILDLVSFTNSGPRIHLGIGDGTFRTTDHFLGTPYSQRGRDGYVVDINQDGHVDIVQALPHTAGLGGASSLKVNLGIGDGTFLASQRVGLLGTDIFPLRFVDIDHDGHLDVVGATNLTPATIAVYAGTRDGLVDMQTVDLNADGFEDVLAVTHTTTASKYFWATPWGSSLACPICSLVAPRKP
ncbi:MAG: hypothetical protein KatS3mg111_1818 [Pirellulaceae bacterium]|nr:MAG: hypothetical protein KatS3mg111_1818 [Pirellulaceae bacterium]